MRQRIVVALRNSECWSDIEAGRRVSSARLHAVIEPAVGTGAHKVIGRKGASADNFMWVYEESAAYLRGFLVANSNAVDDTAFEEQLFDLWAAGIGCRMAGSFARICTKSAAAQEEHYQKRSALNTDILTHLRSRGVPARQIGCLGVLVAALSIAGAAGLLLLL